MFSTVSASFSSGTTTPKPEGLLGKMKDIFSQGKEILKEKVENVVGDKKDDKKMSFEASAGASANMTGSSSSTSASASSSSQLSQPSWANQQMGGSSQASASSQAQVSLTIGSSTPKPESLLNKMSSMVNKTKETAKDLVSTYDEKTGKREGPVDKMTKLVSKGTEAVKDTVHKIEEKVNEVGEKVEKAADENIFKPMQSVSGSGQQTSGGQLSVQAQANSQLKGMEKEKHLTELKKKQEGEMGRRPQNLKEIIQEAKAKGVIPQNEDRSVLKGNHADEKSMAVEVFDKAHEMSKIPVETVLKPIDKMLGYEKDPLLRMYDNSHELLRKPLGLVAKPVESVLTGAFKTTEEAKKDSEKLLATTSDQERREAKMKEEKAKKEDRSVVGDIVDKARDLGQKPIEIALKPLDHAFGFDKNGKKNPVLQLLDEIYSLSKKPVDSLAKPLESILRKMGEDPPQGFQVSIRFNSDDPKLVTRLADGALNIADRVITKPLEVVMKPLDHMLGFDEPGKKNPIVEATHSLKNATKIGVELFTRPIDRIIKEIADIGDKSGDELEAEYERRREQASRLVAALDKIHQVAQAPFEIVLRPVGKALGYSEQGKKEPFLRAWDTIHQVVRTPIQVISKPIEDALLGEKPTTRRFANKGKGIQAQAKASASFNGGNAKSGASASINLGGGKSAENHKKNFIIDGIKRVEKMASKPIEVITLPIRKLILGEDNEKVGSETEKNNREIQSKAQANSTSGGSSVSAQLNLIDGPKNSNKPDKIIKTIKKMNNVILKPLEEITQPLVDILSSESSSGKGDQKKLEIKAQTQVQSSAQSSSSQNQNQNQPQSQSQSHSQVQLQAKSQSSAQSQSGGGQAQAQAQAKLQVQQKPSSGH